MHVADFRIVAARSPSLTNLPAKRKSKPIPSHRRRMRKAAAHPAENANCALHALRKMNAAGSTALRSNWHGRIEHTESAHCVFPSLGIQGRLGLQARFQLK